jgi:hypothetical protein
LTSTATTFKLDFPAACAGKSVKVAFYAESTVNNASNRLYLGNIVFDDGNRCIEPTDLTATNVTSRKATVGWTSEGDLFNLQYKKSGDAAWTNVNGINAKTYELTGLTPKTAYIFRVQTVCSSTKQSIWSEEGTFTTQFGVPFTETFVNSSRPEGWTSYSTLMSGVLDGTTTLSEHENNGAWGFYDGWAYTGLKTQYGKQWLVTPDIIVDVDNSQLTFDLKLVCEDQTGTDDQFAVLITDDGGNTWTQLALWNNSGSQRVFNKISYRGQREAISLSAYTGKSVRLAFYAESTVANAENTIYMSNVSIDAISAADAHLPQSLAVSNVTTNSATLTWGTDADVTSWNIRYGLRIGSDFWYTATSTTNSCTLTGLNGGTFYDVQVQAVSASGESNWSSVLFTTELPTNNQCNISYLFKSENKTLGWNGTTIKVIDVKTGIEMASLTLAAGKNEETGTLALTQNREYRFAWIPKDYYDNCSYYFYDVNGDEFLHSDNGVYTSRNNNLITFTMDCTVVNCHQPKDFAVSDIDFHSAKLSWTPGDDDQTEWEIKYQQTTSYFDPDRYGVSVSVTENPYTFTGLTQNREYVVYVRGVKGEEKSKWSRKLNFWTKNEKAVPTDVEADNETFTTADVDWTVNGIEAKWDIRYRIEGTYGAFSTVSVTEHPYTLTDLTPDTEYEVQVRAVYDDASYGSWSEKGYIWTVNEKAMPSDLEQTAATTTTATLGWKKNGIETKWNLLYHVSEWVKPILTVDFEDGLPEGWTTIDNDGDGRTWKIASNEDYVECHKSAACIVSASYMNQVGALHPDNWLVTPQIELGGLVKFWMRGQDDSDYMEHFAVYVSTTGTDVADFIEVMPETVAKDEYTMYIVDLSAYSGQGYVAFRHFNCTDQFYLNLDDVTILGPDDECGLKKDLTETSCTITGLTLGTLYEAQVQPVYDDGTTGNWTDSEWFGTVPRGDVNGDFKYNVTDIVYLVSYLKNGTKLPGFLIEAADVDNNGEVDENDIPAIENIIMTP